MNIRNIAVIGMGRVGLPLSLVLAHAGFNVVGIDVNPERLEKLRKKQFPFREDQGLALLKQVYGKGFRVAHESEFPEILPTVQAVIITLGTTIDSTLTPSVKDVTDFFGKFAPSMRKRQLFILRSTLTPGTTEFVGRFIKKTTGFTVGKDVFLACCPERIAEGHAIKELSEIPQIVGTDDAESARLATQVFKKIIGTFLYTDPRSAELAKLMCNMYRYIDFAIGNEFMLIAESHGRNIHEITRLVNDGYKRGGVKGPGLTAGACLVKDGFFLIDKSPYLDLIAAAWRVNESIPGFLIGKLKSMLPTLHGKRVAILGLGFKKNIDDTRYSLSLKLRDYLIYEGADVAIHDPFLPSLPLAEAVRGADAVIIAVNHDVFGTLTQKKLGELAKKHAVVCDIWDMLDTGTIVFRLP